MGDTAVDCKIAAGVVKKINDDRVFIKILFLCDGSAQSPAFYN